MNTTDEDRAERFTLLFALEVQRIVRHLDQRMPMLVKLWSRHRAREPFLETLFTRWRTLGFHDLALIEESAHVPLERFYELVDDLRHYIAYTEDMPVTLGDAVEVELNRLRAAAEEALLALGFSLHEEE